QFDVNREVAALDAAGDGVEGGGDAGGLVGGEQADLGEHAGVGLAGADVVAVQAAVVGDRLGERLDARVGAALEAAAPGLLAHGDSPSRNSTAPVARSYIATTIVTC